MKQFVSALALLGVFLFSSGAGCSNKSTDPQPATTLSPLNAFDAYMVGTWDFQSAVLTFKKDGKVNSTFKSANYSYAYVFDQDHTFFAAVTVSGPLGTNITSVQGKWATSITAGSKPPGSFAYPAGPGPSTATKPTMPFSFILTPQGTTNTGLATNNQTCYILYMDSSDNTIAFDWISADGSAETWEIWRKIK